MRILTVTCVALATVMAGCASGGPSGNEVLTGSIAPSKARLVIYRPSPMGFAIQPDYTINGKSIASSQPRGFVVCDMAPGAHTVRVANVAGDANLSFSGSETAKISLQPGQTTYLRADIQPGLIIGAVTISQVTEAQGRQDVSSLSKIEAQLHLIGSQAER